MNKTALLFVILFFFIPFLLIGLVRTEFFDKDGILNGVASPDLAWNE